MNKGFLKAGHLPTLFAAFLCFDLSFMAWVVLGPLAVMISKDLGLNDAQTGLAVFAILAPIAVLGLTGVKRRWRSTWGAFGVSAACV